jgi:hypothetical protein
MSNHNINIPDYKLPPTTTPSTYYKQMNEILNMMLENINPLAYLIQDYLAHAQFVCWTCPSKRVKNGVDFKWMGKYAHGWCHDNHDGSLCGSGSGTQVWLTPLGGIGYYSSYERYMSNPTPHEWEFAKDLVLVDKIMKHVHASLISDLNFDPIEMHRPIGVSKLLLGSEVTKIDFIGLMEDEFDIHGCIIPDSITQIVDSDNFYHEDGWYEHFLYIIHNREAICKELEEAERISKCFGVTGYVKPKPYIPKAILSEDDEWYNNNWYR